MSNLAALAAALVALREEVEEANASPLHCDPVTEEDSTDWYEADRKRRFEAALKLRQKDAESAARRRQELVDMGFRFYNLNN